MKTRMWILAESDSDKMHFDNPAHIPQIGAYVRTGHEFFGIVKDVNYLYKPKNHNSEFDLVIQVFLEEDS